MQGLKKPDKLFKPSYLFVAFMTALILLNSLDLLKETVIIREFKKSLPFRFLGLKFAGLENTFRDIPYIGYYTDKDLNEKQNAAQFAQAQYILAPTILDLNNTDHEFILFDCTATDKALKKIREIHAAAIKKNDFGIILTRKIK